MMREGEKDVSASYCSQETRRLASDYIKVYKIINMSIHVLNRTIRGQLCGDQITLCEQNKYKKRDRANGTC